MADVEKIYNIGKKVIPVVGAAVVAAGSYMIGKLKGITKGKEIGKQEASESFAEKFEMLVNKFEEYKRKQK